MRKFNFDLDLYEALDGKKFSTFSEMKKVFNEYILEQREKWLMSTLVANNIPVKKDMSKKDLHTVLEKHLVTVTINTKEDRDEIRIGPELVGYWCNKHEYYFTNKTIEVKIEFAS